jgi:DNA-binding MarR family transcriptional regulator
MATAHSRNDTSASEDELEAYTLLRQVNSMLDTYNRYDLRNEELTVPQFAILSHATPEGVPLSEISARMLCDNSNLTGIVDRLISKGLVERRPDPQDRRVSLICLTSQGADKLRRIRPRHYASVRERLRALSQTEVQQLRTLLQSLYEDLQADAQPQRQPIRPRRLDIDA